MKIRYHKPVSVYTHPSITQYEFERMKKVEKTYLVSCAAGFLIVLFSFPFALISSAKETKHVTVSTLEKPKQEVKPKPEVKPLQELTYDVPKEEPSVDVGSVTIDSR